jgi:hypothetical protein
MKENEGDMMKKTEIGKYYNFHLKSILNIELLFTISLI